jgi:alginate O-acetyltransferase complex protein AlgI
MDIVSYRFAIIAVSTVFVFYLIDSKFRIWFLALLSCVFIATFSYLLLLYILVYSLFNYYIGIKIHETNFKVAFFRTGVFLNLAQLFVLKYPTLVIDPAIHLFNFEFHFTRISEIIIPLGISYFTLQGIGYLVNIKMGWEKPEYKYINFFLYTAFYPKFLSGPVEQSNHFLPQLVDLGSFDRQNIVIGFRLVLLGLLKKNIIANQLSIIVNPVYNDLSTHGGSMLLLVILIQPLYIYFDFSGYTDIARGFAKTYGIDLLPNFDRPFFSENVTTFWKRFHMSLALWFNDYIFKQLCFKLRKWKTHATIAAVVVTWLLFGIWHGAGWNFMVLGLLQALAINYEFFTKRLRTRLFSKIPINCTKFLGRLLTYLFYGISLVFFFSPNLKTSLAFFHGLKYMDFPFTVSKTLIIDNIVDIISYSAAFGILIVFLIIEKISCDNRELHKKIESLWTCDKFRFHLFRFFIYYIALLLMFYFGGMQTKFIYFQF